MSRCLFVATDGSPAAQSALRYAIEVASSLRVDEIACLSVHEDDGSRGRPFTAAVVGAEMALATGNGGLMILDQPEMKPRRRVEPDAVLDGCSREVTAAGLRFTPVSGSGVPSDVIADTGHIGEAIFLGRNSDECVSESRRVGATASSVLQSVRQTVVICPASVARVERLILVLAGGLGDAELVARAATWAEAMKLPVHIAIGENGRAMSTHSLHAAQRVLADTSLATSGESYSCRPEEFVESLRPSDLLLVARSRRWRALHFWFGSGTDRIVERACGPVAVIAQS